ncbi:MAG TPA: DUF4397 domain-containing protein [Chitinophagaceae bacterium]|nr:DUF4397 domain-containing protein [Chitinophagaceae bacterium]
MRKGTLLLLSSLLLAAGLSLRCRKEQAIPVLTPSQADYARLSVTNAALVNANLHFYVDGKPVSLPDSLDYGTTVFVNSQVDGVSVPSPYLFMPYGYLQLGFSLAGSDNLALALTDYLKRGENYSVFVIDSLQHGQLRSVLLHDDLGTKDTLHTKLRFINLSPDAPALDVYIYPNAGTEGYQLFSGRAYLGYDQSKIREEEKFTLLPAGPYYLTATEAGTNNILLEGGLIMPGNSIITIYVKGLLRNEYGNKDLNVGVIRFQHP